MQIPPSRGGADESALSRRAGVGQADRRRQQPHTTPVIVETATGTAWSVDSWTKPYGQSPDIMTISEWKSKD
jgi:hypothetical protein